MQADLESIHIGLSIVIGVISLGGLVVNLMIKNNQSTVKEELVARQNDMRVDMDQKHAENRLAISVHAAEDKQIFESLRTSLSEIKGMIRSNGSSSHRTP